MRYTDLVFRMMTLSCHCSLQPRRKCDDK